MREIYEDVIDSIEDAIIVLDVNGNIVIFNQAAENITDISKNRAIGLKGEDIFGGNAEILCQAGKTFESGQIFSDYDTTLIGRENHILPVSIITSPILRKDGAISGTVLAIRDISRMKELEDDIRRSDGLASIGILAAGLAHEIRNPLGGIRGAAQLLEKDLEKNEELKEYTALIIKETSRVSGLIDELLDFANPTKLNLKKMNIHEVLDSVISLETRSPEGEKINFMTDYDPSIPDIVGDREKLGQVFLNIVKNGCEAVKGEGSLIVSTRVASDFMLAEGGNVRSKVIIVDIADNGSGISPDDMKMLFTPFFTRKGRGTGLGLAVSLRIIKEHRGKITVESKSGEGSRFSVSLPVR